MDWKAIPAKSLPVHLFWSTPSPYFFAMTNRNKLKANELAKLSDGMHSDGAGLYFRVRGNSRYWIYRYRIDGKTKDVGIGLYPTVSLAKARTIADGFRENRVDGVDPLEKKRETKAARRVEEKPVATFGDMIEPCIANMKNIRQWRTEAQEIRWRRTLTKYTADIANKPLDKITPDNVITTLKKIWNSKTETAANLQRYIACVFSYASATGTFNGANPAAWRDNLEHFLPSPSKCQTVEHRAALPYKDLPLLVADLSTRYSIVAKAIIFGTATAARASEFVLAEWKEIDFETAVWICPRRKDGKPYPHRVPLAPEVIRLLHQLPRVNEYLFPGLRGHGHIALESPIKMLKVLMPDVSVSMHGMRSTFRDWAQEHGHDRVLAEKALMHATGNAVEQAYQRSDLLEQRRPMMDDWAKFLFSKIDHDG